MSVGVVVLVVVGVVVWVAWWWAPAAALVVAGAAESSVGLVGEAAVGPGLDVVGLAAFIGLVAHLVGALEVGELHGSAYAADEQSPATAEIDDS
jgi:hypothetical protein